MIGLVIVVTVMFLWMIRASWSHWCLSDAVQDRIENAKEILRRTDTRLCKLESQTMAMNRTFQERFDGVNGHISAHETALDSAKSRLEAAEAFRENIDGRLQLVGEQLDKCHKRIVAAYAMNDERIEGHNALSRRIHDLEQQADPDEFKDWRQTVGQMLSEHGAVISGVLAKLDAQDNRLANWPEEIRAEVAAAYRDMADAIEHGQPAEASA